MFDSRFLPREALYWLPDRRGRLARAHVGMACARCVTGTPPRVPTTLDIPVLALGGAAFIGDRNESQMRLMADNVTGHTFGAGHDLAEEVPDEMADVVLPFLATHR